MAADQVFSSSDAAVLSRQESSSFCQAKHHLRKKLLSFWEARYRKIIPKIKQ